MATEPCALSATPTVVWIGATEIIALEIEKQLREKHESGGGGISLSLSERGERLGMSKGDFLRQFAELVDAGKVKPSFIEVCG